MRQLLAIVILAITVYGIVDCARADARTRRNVPLWAWVALMLLLPGIGAVVWLVVSRLIEPTAPRPAAGPVAPDDDPEFLRYLERRARERAEGGDHPGTPGGRPDPTGAVDGEDDTAGPTR